MANLIIFFTLILFVHAQQRGIEDECEYCVGEAYECVAGQCYYATGFIPNYYQNGCIKCPGIGEKCYGPCCTKYGNDTLHCWRGICQPCYGPKGNWICRDPMEHVILISGTQIIMAAALVLGIIATFVLLYKLCAATNLRPVGTRSANSEGRLSVGSLQIYVDERLRDAPPRYTRTAPSGSAVFPAAVYLNAGFIHDNTLPPPAYSPQRKNDTDPDMTVHI